MRDMAEIEAGYRGACARAGVVRCSSRRRSRWGIASVSSSWRPATSCRWSPAIRSFADEGGLLSYGVYIPELFRQAASYVRSASCAARSPRDLPVQQPSKFEFVINLQTARALGIDVPPTVLALADEVIE